MRFAGQTRYSLLINEELEELRTDVMKTSTGISRSGWALVVVTVLLGLSACGSSSKDSSQATTHHSAKQAAASQHGDGSERAPEDMVAAVSAGKGGPPVELKYELRGAPKAGEELDVDIAVLPVSAAINRLYARFQGGGEIELVDGAEISAIEKPAQGSVIRHLLRVLPKQDGIFTLNAAVSVELADDSVTRTFTIPLIVGEGLADLSAKSEGDGKDAAAGTSPKAH